MQVAAQVEGCDYVVVLCVLCERGLVGVLFLLGCVLSCGVMVAVVVVCAVLMCCGV